MANVQNSPHSILMNGHNRIETSYNINNNTCNMNHANTHIVSHNISGFTHHPNTDDNPGMHICTLLIYTLIYMYILHIST
jgi:hypothetical protein